MRVVYKSAVDEPDVPPEHIELVTKGRWHFHFVDFLLDMIEPP
jgi:hypothetical protein